MKAAPFSRQCVTGGKAPAARDQLEQREAREQADGDIMVQANHRYSPDVDVAARTTAMGLASPLAGTRSVLCRGCEIPLRFV